MDEESVMGVNIVYGCEDSEKMVLSQTKCGERRGFLLKFSELSGLSLGFFKEKTYFRALIT